MAIASSRIDRASRGGLALLLAIGFVACGGDDSGGTGGSAGSGRGGSGGATGSDASADTSTPTGGGGGTGGTAGASGASGRGGAAGIDGGAGKGGTAGAGKGGASGAAGIDSGAAGSGAGGAGKGGASGAAGTGGAAGSAGAPDGSSGSGGSAGTRSDAGPSSDVELDVARDASDGAADATVPIQGPESFHCVNWADPRDNYVNGNLELSGLTVASDTYATVQTKSNAILSEFQTKLKADSIRVPINEPTVSGSWWNAYKAVIDTAVSKGMKVVVAYWAYQNGKPADAAAFKTMWQTVVSAYQGNNLVYFDIHNEPYGYGSGWNDAAAQWLADFPNVPRGRVIVAGTGYDDNVNPVGSDARFAGCILQLHIYGFWHDTWTAKKQWTDSMTSALGSYASRTLVGEWGGPMTTGIDYTNTADGEAYRSYVVAVSDVMHTAKMGSCYWPGLRNGDSYSMTKLNGGSTPTLTVNSTSGLGRLHWSWNVP